MSLSTYQEIPVTALVESTWNPRKHFDAAKLEELAASIREKGVIEPIVVRANGKPGMFEILAGSRRFRASKLAERTHVPAVIRDLDDVAALELAIVENQQRDDVHPLDEAAGYAALMAADPAYTIDVVAAKVGKSASYIYRRMRLLDLAPVVRRAFEADRMTVAHAERLARLTPELQTQAFMDALYAPFFMWSDGEENKPLAERLPNRLALNPLAELDAFIAKRSVVNPDADETQHYFPEIAAAADDAFFERDADADDQDDEPAPATLLQLSTHHHTRNELGLAADAPCPLAVVKWHRITGPKDRCAHVTRGAIVHGDGDQVGQVIDVCATKGCPKHFPVAKKAKSGSSAADTQAAADRRRQEREDEEKRLADQRAFAEMAPALRQAIVAHLAKVRVDAAFVKAILPSYDLRRIGEVWGITLTDKTAPLFLALQHCQVVADYTIERVAKMWGFDLAAFKKRWQAEQDAKGRETLAAGRQALKDKAAGKTSAAAATKKAKTPKAATKAKKR